MVKDTIPDLLWACKPGVVLPLDLGLDPSADFVAGEQLPDFPSPTCVRPAVCIHCGLVVADIPAPEIDREQFGPPAPVRIKSIGCLCTLPRGWLRALVEDAGTGRRIPCGWQGRLLAALVLAGVPSVDAALVADGVIPLRPELVRWAQWRMGGRS